MNCWVEPTLKLAGLGVTEMVDGTVTVNVVVPVMLPIAAVTELEPEETPVAARAADELVSLPLYPAMSDGDVERVIAAVHAALCLTSGGN